MSSHSQNEIDAESKALMGAIFVDKVRRARERPMDQKILDGPRLFDQNCQITRNGIRAQFPEFNDEQVERELRRRLVIARRIDQAGIYTDVGVWDE